MKVLDAAGYELQPPEESDVRISFGLDRVNDSNLEPEIYHITESEAGGRLSAEKLESEADRSAATVAADTDGFSSYSVVFTYEQQNYTFDSNEIGYAGNYSVRLDDILSACYLSVDVTVNAAFRKAPSEPEFVSHQMVLSGQLGLHFCMSIPEGMTDGTLEFFVGKWSVTSDGALQSDGRYRFTCFINSVEMAEMITAVYTYTADGVKKTVTDVISVQDYLEYIISNMEGLASYTAAAPLAKALCNYSHYAGYAVPDGEKHPKMPDSYAAEAGLIGSLSGFGLKAALGGDITAAAFSLDLDCETALNFYLTTDTELSEQNVSVTADDGSSPEYTVARAGTRRHIRVTGIGAHKLGTVYTMTAGETSISASAMTYVQQCLSNTGAPEEAKRVAAALYEYYQQAVRYIH